MLFQRIKEQTTLISSLWSLAGKSCLIPEASSLVSGTTEQSISALLGQVVGRWDILERCPVELIH